MAITVKIEEKQDKEISFPCLMKDVNSELVVLFTDSNAGFVVNPGMGFWVGDSSNTWEDFRDENEWEPSPPITLSNS